MAKENKHFYEFGPYRLDPERRVLLRSGEPVPLTSKAFETLLVLVQHQEQVVSKDELMKRLWPDTFVEESNLTQHVSLLRKALGESPQDHRYIVTLPGRGYRFAERVREISEDGEDLVLERHSRQTVTVEEPGAGRDGEPTARQSKRGGRVLWIAIGCVVAAAAAGYVLIRGMLPRHRMEAGDLVLVTDFVNTTGEPVFDGSLRQALAVKLGESPYFNVAADSVTRQTLKLMDRSADERVVPPMAREVCQREGAKVYIGGSIVRAGDKYTLNVSATNCQNGAELTRQEMEAGSRDEVLAKLGQLSSAMRRKLGESVASIQKFDTPMDQATTKSLAALKAYSSGNQKRLQGLETESIPLFELAIELDPEFAMAYAKLGGVHLNLNQRDVADDDLKKAFERRGHVSEKEKFYIQGQYYELVTKDIDKATETYALQTEVYPRDASGFNTLSSVLMEVGKLDQAITAAQQALRVNRSLAPAYANLARAYERGGRFPEAKAICQKAVTEKSDSFWTHQILYRIAFIEGDDAAMQQEIEWFRGKPQESINIYYQAKAALVRGEQRRARELFERARRLAVQQGPEVVVAMNNSQAQFEADLDNAREARALAVESLRESPKPGTAHGLCRAGAGARGGRATRRSAAEPTDRACGAGHGDEKHSVAGHSSGAGFGPGRSGRGGGGVAGCGALRSRPRSQRRDAVLSRPGVFATEVGERSGGTISKDCGKPRHRGH